MYIFKTVVDELNKVIDKINADEIVDTAVIDCFITIQNALNVDKPRNLFDQYLKQHLHFIEQ